MTAFGRNVTMAKTILLIVIFIVIGCRETPYQRFSTKGTTAGGFIETRISHSEVKYHLAFSGNNRTSPDKVLEYWHKRANELCPYGHTVERLRLHVHEHIEKGETAFFYNGVLIPIVVNTKFKSPEAEGEVLCHPPNELDS